ncbi:MAG: MarC family protein [Bacteroidales bacterium]|nr:MarC family protein [Bacteroidales bacterium]
MNEPMDFIFKEIVNSGLILFSVIDILGSVPIIIDLRQKAGHIQSEKATLAALVIMVLFLFVGEWILNLMGIDVSSFAIAGSFIIFLLAVEMILGISLFKDVSAETASVVPIAFPLIAGAGTLTTLLSLRAEYNPENIIAGIVINLALVYLILKKTNVIERFLGKNGINVLRKVFGIILLAIAVKLFRTNTGI